MPFHIRKYTNGYFVVGPKQENGRYKKMHNVPHETLEKAKKHLIAINYNYYGQFRL